jgi:hypothetical protein
MDESGENRHYIKHEHASISFIFLSFMITNLSISFMIANISCFPEYLSFDFPLSNGIPYVDLF